MAADTPGASRARIEPPDPTQLRARADAMVVQTAALLAQPAQLSFRMQALVLDCDARTARARLEAGSSDSQELLDTYRELVRVETRYHALAEWLRVNGPGADFDV